AGASRRGRAPPPRARPRTRGARDRRSRRGDRARHAVAARLHVEQVRIGAAEPQRGGVVAAHAVGLATAEQTEELVVARERRARIGVRPGLVCRGAIALVADVHTTEIPLAAARGIVEGRIARHHTDVRLAGGAGGAAEGAGRANLAAAGGVARRARAVLHAAAAVAERGMASAQLREAAAERSGLAPARAARVRAAAAVAGGAIIATALAAERRVVEVTHAAVEAGAAVALRVLAGGRRIDAAALLRG